MALFDDVFNKASIYEMLFFNVKSVLIHPTLEDLEAKNKPLFERWKYLSQSKYKTDIIQPISTKGLIITKPEEAQQVAQQDVYEKNAPYYPEYTRIVAITYATLYAENGTLKRFFKKIVNEDEFVVLATFMDVLYELSSEGSKSNPQYFPMFCGHNIISHDIPLLIKRFVLHKDKFENNKQLPYILKRCLNIKPWESGTIDVVNVWKFNGYDQTSLMLIADYLGLKKTVELMPLDELSKYYWDNVSTKPAETLEFVSLQSATQTNLVIQLMNELRQL
jgi:hypothetical protein